MGIFPKVRGENQKCLKPPPRSWVTNPTTNNYSICGLIECLHHHCLLKRPSYRNTNTQPETNKTRKKEKPLTNPPVFGYPAVQLLFFFACCLPSSFRLSHLIPRGFFFRQETDSYHKRCPVQHLIADPHGTPGHAWAGWIGN